MRLILAWYHLTEPARRRIERRRQQRHFRAIARRAVARWDVGAFLDAHPEVIEQHRRGGDRR